MDRMELEQQNKMTEAGLNDGAADVSPTPTFGLVAHDPSGDTYDAESFTSEELQRQKLRQEAAVRVLYDTDLTTCDDAMAGALFRSVTRNLFGVADTDGDLCFKKRKSADMKQNVVMLRDALSGKNTKPLYDPQYEEYLKQDRAGRLKIAAEEESVKAAATRKMPGWVGVALKSIPQSSALGVKYVEGESVGETDAERAERLKNDEDKLLANYEEKMASNQPLITLLSQKGALTDRAGWILTKSVADGRLDATSLATIPSKEQRERVIAGFGAIMGDRKTTNILGMTADISTDTVGDRLQMMLGGAQDALLGLFVDGAQLGGDIRDWIGLKSIRDVQEREEVDEMIRLERVVGETNKRPLPEGSLLGEAGQTLAENWHWFIPYKTGTMAKAKHMKDVAKLKKGKAIASVLEGQRVLAQLGFEGETALAATVGKYDRAIARIQKIERALGKAKHWHTAELAAAKAMTVSSFAEEFVTTCDINGISREESIPWAIAVGFINDKIEQIEVPFLSEDIGKAQLEAIGMRSLIRQLKKHKIGEYIKKRAGITLKAGLKVGVEEGLVEEPLQQLVIEHGMVAAEDFDGVLDGHGKPLTDAARAVATDYINRLFNGEDLRTYVETSMEMIPAMGGYIATTGIREQMRHGASRLWNSKFDKRKFNPNEGYAEMVANERQRQHATQTWLQKTGDTREYGDLLRQARLIYDEGAGKGSAILRFMNELGMPQNLAEIYADTFADEDLSVWSGNAQSLAMVKGYQGVTLEDKDFEALGAIKGSVRHDSSRGLTMVSFEVNPKTDDTSGAKKGRMTILYRLGATPFYKADGSFDEEKFNAQLADDSDFGVSWDARNDDQWRDKSPLERKRLLLTYWQGVTDQGGMLMFRDDKTGEEQEVPVDAVISLATGRVRDIAYQVLSAEDAEAISHGQTANGWTLYHETWHALWRVAKMALSDEEKLSLAKDLNVDITQDGWEKRFDEAAALEFEQWGAGLFATPKAVTRFEKLQSWAAGVLEAVLGPAPKQQRVDEYGKLAGDFKLGAFFQDVLDGKLGSPNMRITRTNTEEGQRKEDVVGSPSGAHLPVEVTDEDRKKAEEEARGESEAVQAEEVKAGEVPSQTLQDDGTKKWAPRKSTQDWDFGNRIVMENPKTPNVKYHGNVKVMDLRKILNSFIPGVKNPYQNRDEATQDAMAAVAKMVPNVNFNFAGLLSPAFGGSTLVVDKQGYAVVGNHRVRAIQLAAQQNNDAWKKYRQQVLEEADARGLEISDEALEFPVLVVELDHVEGGEGLSMNDIGKQSNVQQTRGSNVYEQATDDAEQMAKLGTIDRIETRADGSIDLTKEDTVAALAAFKDAVSADGFFEEEVRGEGADAHTWVRLSEDGARRVGNAVIALLLGGDKSVRPLMKALTDERRLDIHNEKAALMKVAADVLKLASERKIYDIRENLNNALSIYTQWREADEAKRAEKGMTEAQWSKKKGYPFEAFVAQQDLFKSRDVVGEIIARRLAESRSQRSFTPNGDETAAGQERAIKYIADWFAKFAERARKVNVETDDMFGTPPASKEDLLSLAFSVASTPTIQLPKNFFSDIKTRYGTTTKAVEAQAILADGAVLKGKGILTFGALSFGHTFLMDDVRKLAPHDIEGAAALANDEVINEFLAQEHQLDRAAWHALAEAHVIRMTYGGQGMQFFGAPTKKQESTLWDIVDDAQHGLEEGETLIVDFADTWGDVALVKEYGPKASPRAVIDDAKAWYGEHVRPVGSVSRRAFSVAPHVWRDPKGQRHTSLRELRPVRGTSVHWERNVSMKPQDDFDSLQVGIMVGTRVKKYPGGFAPTLTYALRPENRLEVGEGAYSQLLAINDERINFGDKSYTDAAHLVRNGDHWEIPSNLTNDDLMREHADEIARAARAVKASGATAIIVAGQHAELDRDVAKAISEQAGVPLGEHGAIAIVAFAGHAGNLMVERVKSIVFNGDRLAAIQTVCHEGNKGYCRFFLDDINGQTLGSIKQGNDAHKALTKLAKWANILWSGKIVQELPGYEATLELLSRMTREAVNIMTDEGLVRQLSMYDETYPMYKALTQERRRTQTNYIRMLNARRAFSDFGIERIINVVDAATLLQDEHDAYALQHSYLDKDAIVDAIALVKKHLGAVTKAITDQLQKGANVLVLVPYNERSALTAADVVLGKYVSKRLDNLGYGRFNRIAPLKYSIRNGAVRFEIPETIGSDIVSMQAVLLTANAGSGTILVEAANALRRKHPHPVFSKIVLASLAADMGGAFNTHFTGDGNFDRLSLNRRSGILGYDQTRVTLAESVLLYRGEADQLRKSGLFVESGLLGSRPEYNGDGERGAFRFDRRVRRVIDQSHPSGEQKSGDALYPNVGAEIRGLSFAVGAKRKEEYRKQLDKYRPDLSVVDRENILNEIDRYNNTKKEKLSVHWTICGTVILPEDEYKVDLAIKTSERAKIDPFSYQSPTQLINAYSAYVPKEPPINPDSVTELKNRVEIADGIVVYDVDETPVFSKEAQAQIDASLDPLMAEAYRKSAIEHGEARPAGQIAMRKIINTHWGKDASPWCLLQGEADGRLTDRSLYYWNHYSALPKRVAFKDGRLLAFMATSGSNIHYPEQHWRDVYKEETGKDAGEWISNKFRYSDDFNKWQKEQALKSIVEQWWDRNDESHLGIPVSGKLPNDPLGRTGTYEYDSSTKERTIVGKLKRGNNKDGVEEVWNESDALTERTRRSNGETVEQVKWYNDGGLRSVETKGKTYVWHENGNLKSCSIDNAVEGKCYHIEYDDVGGSPARVTSQDIDHALSNYILAEWTWGYLSRFETYDKDGVRSTMYIDNGERAPYGRYWNDKDGRDIMINYHGSHNELTSISVIDKLGNVSLDFKASDFKRTHGFIFRTLAEYADWDRTQNGDALHLTDLARQLDQFESDVRAAAKACGDVAESYKVTRPAIPAIPGLSDDVIRFSVAGTGAAATAEGRRKDLVALHNIKVGELRSVLQLGGFAMPSVAITKDTIPHEHYGEVTILFKPSAIDPKANRYNKVYSGDAWTPVFPTVDPEIDTRVMSRINKTLYELLKKGDVDDLFANGWYNFEQDDGIVKTIAGQENPADGYATDELVKAAYLISRGETIEQVKNQDGTVDRLETKRAVRSRVDNDSPDYIKWLYNLFDGLVVGYGLRNEKGLYTRAGNPRTWKQLHDAVTLDNAVRIMRHENEQANGSYNNTSFEGASAQTLKSLGDVVSREGQLRELPEDEYKATKRNLQDQFSQLVYEYRDAAENAYDNPVVAFDRAADMLLDTYLEKKGRVMAMLPALNTWGYYADEDFARRFVDLMQKAGRVPTRYFEAKPMRAVYFNDVAAAIVPAATPDDVLHGLESNGVKVYKYHSTGDASDRTEVTRQAADDTHSAFSVAPAYTGSAPDHREAPLDEDESKPDFSVANRKYAWKDYAGLPDRVFHATIHKHLVGNDNPITSRLYERFKELKVYDRTNALRIAEGMTKSIWAKERYLGHYLLGKHYGEYDSARLSVRHLFQPSVYNQIENMRASVNKPIRWLYVHNDDSSNTNMMPKAFADELAERFGGTSDGAVVKKSDERNTGASMRDRAGRNFEWIGPVDNDSVYIIVDDVWTTGSTTVSLLEYLHSQGADVRGIAVLATASNRDHIRPTDDDWAKFLHNARMDSLKQVQKVIGFDPEKLTGSEVYAYGVKGKQGKSGLSHWFELSLGQFELPGGLFNTPTETRFSVSMPRISDMSDDDLIVAALAAGMAINPREATENSKHKSAYGFFRKNRKATERLVAKAHPEFANDYSQVMRLAHILMMRAQMEAHEMQQDLERGVSESEILKRLPKKLIKTYHGELATQRREGGRIISRGVQAKTEVEKRWENKVAAAVRVQSGIEPELFEQWLGTDLTNTLLDALSNPREHRIPTKDESSNSQHVETEDVGTESVGGVLPVGHDQSLNIEEMENPRKFAQYVMGRMESYWREKSGIGGNANVLVWNDAVALQFARKTAQRIFQKLIRAIVYSGMRETALRNIDRFEYAATPHALESMMTYAGEIIHAQHIRETKQQMLEDLDTFLKQHLGASGRFKPDKEELRRKVTAELELRARYMRHAMWLTKEAAEAESLELQEEADKLIGKYSANEKDVEQARRYRAIQRETSILREFGALKDKTLGEIEDAVNYWKAAADDSGAKILQDIRDREIRTVKAADALAAAVVNPKRKTGVEPGVAKSINDYLVAHMGFVSMLQDMTRHATGDIKRRADTLINYIAREIQKAGDKAKWETSQQSDAFVKAVEAIYRKPFRKVMSEMNETDARFERFMGEYGGKRVKPTKARAMQLLVSLLQGKKPGDDYYDNAVKHNRHQQAPEIASLLSAQDMNIINWIGKWYEQNRQGLSQVAEQLFGIGVYSENANYFPVKMKLEKQGLEKMEGVAWTIFPKALTPRVRNERDFDTRVDIFSLWQSRMAEAAQWKAHAKMGLEMRGIFGRSNLQEAIVANHGNKVNDLVQAFITDILTGSAPTQLSESGVEKAADWVRGWTALTALGGNVGVTFKQTTSIPAFGFEIGLVNSAKYIVTAFSPDGIAAMRKLWHSTQRQMRWDSGSSEAVANALRSENASAIKKLFQASMITNKIGDVVPGLVIGQGIYRDRIESGMSEEDAMAETWMLIERTQQSSRIENQPQMQRRVKLGRMMYQFLSTQQQYLQYEIRAARELVARPGVDTAGRLARAIALNHFILTTLYYWMGVLYNAMLGQEPPDDWLKDWMIANLLGPFGSLFVLGFVCKATLTRALKGYYNLKQEDMLPMEGYMKRQIADGSDLVGAIFDNTMSWSDVLDEAVKWLKDVSPTVRDVIKIDRNIVRPDEYKRDEKRKKKQAARRRELRKRERL